LSSNGRIVSSIQRFSSSEKASTREPRVKEESRNDDGTHEDESCQDDVCRQTNSRDADFADLPHPILTSTRSCSTVTMTSISGSNEDTATTSTAAAHKNIHSRRSDSRIQNKMKEVGHLCLDGSGETAARTSESKKIRGSVCNGASRPPLPHRYATSPSTCDTAAIPMMRQPSPCLRNAPKVKNMVNFWSSQAASRK
jgi:hypothetical protein